jgi:hypothetical protein
VPAGDVLFLGVWGDSVCCIGLIGVGWCLARRSKHSLSSVRDVLRGGQRSAVAWRRVRVRRTIVRGIKRRRYIQH